VKCYIVGSGFGLDVKFLDTIRDFSFSCNAIGSIYNQTTWRPTAYTLTSENFRNKDRRGDYLSSMKQARLVFADKELINKYGITNAFPLTVKTYPDIPEWQPEWFSCNPLEWVSKFGTSLLPAVQIAFYIGFDEVVFVGCDGYNPEGKRQHVEGYPEWADNFDVCKFSKTLTAAHELIAYHAKRKNIKVVFIGNSQFERIYD
jgi:hypothetical protein